MHPLDYSIYLVAQTNMCDPKRFLSIVEAAVQGGVTLVQLREKDANTRDFVSTALALKSMLDKYDAPLLINDRIDVALACDAAGVHLGQDDMPITIARQILGPDKIIGISASNNAEAITAQAQGADYIGASPVFATPTKTDTAAPLALEGLQRMAQAVSIPVVAVGGMKAHNAADVRRHGATGIAVVSAIMCAPDPRAAAKELRKAFAPATG